MLYVVFWKDRVEDGHGLGQFVGVFNREQDANEVAYKRNKNRSSENPYYAYVAEVRADNDRAGDQLVQENIRADVFA